MKTLGIAPKYLMYQGSCVAGWFSSCRGGQGLIADIFISCDDNQVLAPDLSPAPTDVDIFISRDDNQVLAPDLPPAPTDVDLRESEPRPYVNSSIAAHKEVIQLILPCSAPRTSLGWGKTLCAHCPSLHTVPQDRQWKKIGWA